MNKPIIQGHLVLTVTICILTVATTAGYGIACTNVSDKLAGNLRNKLNKEGKKAKHRNFRKGVKKKKPKGKSRNTNNDLVQEALDRILARNDTEDGDEFEEERSQEEGRAPNALATPRRTKSK